MLLKYYNKKAILFNPVTRLLLRCMLGKRWRELLLPLGRRNPMFLCERGDVVVICGSWKWQESAQFYAAVGRKGQVIVIEANPDTLASIEHDARRHGVPEDNVKFIHRGVWDKSEKLSYLVNEDEYRGWDKVLSEDLADFPVNGSKKITIPLDPLDVILKECGISKVDVVALTVNGAELRALKGMKRLLDENVGLRISTVTGRPSPSTEVKEYLCSEGIRTKGYSCEVEGVKDSNFKTEWLISHNG